MARCDQVVAKAHLSARLHMVLLPLGAPFHAHQASCLMARPLALSLVVAQLACFDRDAPLPTHQEEVEEEQAGNNRENWHKCQFDLKISAYDNTKFAHNHHQLAHLHCGSLPGTKNTPL